MAGPTAPTQDVNQYAKHIAGVVHDYAAKHPKATPKDYADAIIDDGESVYKTAESSDSGHGKIELDKYMTGLQTYINEANGQGINGASAVIPALAAQSALTGYHASSWEWFKGTHSTDENSIPSAISTYATKFDTKRTAPEVSASIIKSMGAEGFDPQRVKDATAILNGMKLSDLKVLDQELMGLRTLDRSSGNVDAIATQYSIIADAGRTEYGSGNASINAPFNKVLNVLGHQPINSGDTQREAVVKGMLAASDKGDGQAHDTILFSDVSAAVKHIGETHEVVINDGVPIAATATATTATPNPGGSNPGGAHPNGSHPGGSNPGTRHSAGKPKDQPTGGGTSGGANGGGNQNPPPPPPNGDWTMPDKKQFFAVSLFDKNRTPDNLSSRLGDVTKRNGFGEITSFDKDHGHGGVDSFNKITVQTSNGTTFIVESGRIEAQQSGKPSSVMTRDTATGVWHDDKGAVVPLSNKTFLAGADIYKEVLLTNSTAAPTPTPTPTPPPPPPPRTGDRPRNTIHFGFNQSNIDSDAAATLKADAQYLKDHNITSTTVDAYTDEVGSASYNQGLSDKRAQAVATELKKDGYTGQVTTAGHGKNDPVVNTTKANVQNRRATVGLNAP